MRGQTREQIVTRISRNARIIREVVRKGRPVKAVAREEGVCLGTVYGAVRRYQAANGAPTRAERNREIIRLVFEEGRTYQEVGERFGLTFGGVYHIVKEEKARRGIQRLPVGRAAKRNQRRISA